ncbi:hypothetical protein DACRYDRAFT_107050 [Dacryopinax primogenitus]|uniref:Cytosol aminopeptidase domain-containing protein n=1 Tax=Dacryopinax primogenitus (strain DJM 731) TaxID=1858805 RepID=M5G1L5_DACPD|nr:uncharacterized protein DACRYDRAFT_107050 [Dacryopinax primogenitus]EJU02105.1 hypothetical protein DACRYDRAFT_107050 [Dacryopinax primogenitus]
MLVNITLDDTSPILTYTDPSGQPDGSNLWGEPIVADNCSIYYYDSSFTGTDLNGATMSLTFNGTGIWIYGANRVNHGNYSISVDNQDFGPLSGYANDNSCVNVSDFKVQLFGQAGLSMGTHDLTLTNIPTGTNNNWLDVDFVIFETEIGDTGASEQHIDDSSGQFNWSSGWSTSIPTGQSSYHDGTLHKAVTSDASVIFTFEGQAISLYGAVDPSYGSFIAVMDSGELIQLNTHSYGYYPQTLLYHANSLGEGVHKLTLSNGPSSFDVDYATIWSTGAASGTTDGPGPTGSNNTPIGAIVGGVVGGVIFIALVGALLKYWQYRRQKQESMEAEIFAYSIPHPMIPLPAEHTPSRQHRADIRRKGAPPGTARREVTSLSAGPTLPATSSSTQWASFPDSRNAQSPREHISPMAPRTQPSILRNNDARHVAGYRNEEEPEVGDGAETSLLPPDYSQATILMHHRLGTEEELLVRTYNCVDEVKNCVAHCYWCCRNFGLDPIAVHMSIEHIFHDQARSIRSALPGNAEGRLVLADALYYVTSEFKPHTVIDAATLTGAMMIALGELYAGVFTNSDSLWSELQLSGAEETRPGSGAQTGGRPAEACTAAIFLKVSSSPLPLHGCGRSSNVSIAPKLATARTA